MDNGARFLSVTRAIVEDISVGRIIPQQAGAGESAEEQHFSLKRVRHRYHCGRSADIADNAEHLIFFEEGFHCYCSPGGLIAVVCRNKSKSPTKNPPSIIRSVKRCFDAQLHILAELFSSATERRGNAKTDFVISDSTN